MFGPSKHLPVGASAGMPDYIRNMNKQPTLQAPKGRGMFGRFADILMGGEYGDEQMGWVERLGRGAQGMNQYRDEMRQQARLDQAKAEQDKHIKEMGMHLPPHLRSLAKVAPNAVASNLVDSAFAKPDTPDPFTLSAGQTRFDAQGNPIASVEAPADETERKTTKDAFGRLRFVDTGEVVPGFGEVRPAANGITIGADGTVQIGGPAGAATTRQMANQDAQYLAEAREQANNLTPVVNSLYAARSELLGPDGREGTNDDLDTGAYAPYMQGLRRFIPGEQENETRYDNLDALSKEYGIEKLAGIGGNDTERELITAIQTGPNMGAQESSNLSRINRQIATFEFIGESRRNFASQWLAQHGSLSRLAQGGPYSGMTFDDALSVFQRDQAVSKGLLGNAPSGESAAQSQVGITEQQGDLTDEEYQEYLALKRELGK